jgi:hypothetical protein
MATASSLPTTIDSGDQLESIRVSIRFSRAFYRILDRLVARCPRCSSETAADHHRRPLSGDLIRAARPSKHSPRHHESYPISSMPRTTGIAVDWRIPHRPVASEGTHRFWLWSKLMWQPPWQWPTGQWLWVAFTRVSLAFHPVLI